MKRLLPLLLLLLTVTGYNAQACGDVVAIATAGTIACQGGTTTVNVTAYGGVGHYTGIGVYTVTAGTYTYWVTDSCGFTDSATVSIVDPPYLYASMSWAAIPCHGATALTTVSAIGGTPPYSGTGSFAVSAGTPSFTVTDGNGCTSVASMTITEPAAINVSATAGTIACAGGATTVNVTATGGTGVYNGTGTYTVTAGSHTYNITDNNGCTATGSVVVNEPATLTAGVSGNLTACAGGNTSIMISANGGTAPYTGTGSFSVGAGSYTYTVTDAQGCTATTTATVTSPAALAATTTAGSISCNGGTAAVSVSAAGGTAPYTGTGTFTAVAGTHTYTVTDAMGCSATSSATITQPAALGGSATAGTAGCNTTTTVNIAATGGTAPYTGTGTYTVGAGSYVYTVTDGNGCTTNIPVTVPGSSTLMAEATATPIVCNGGTSTIIVSATGGLAPYSGPGTFTVGAGIHSYTVTDANGCSSTVTLDVAEPAVVTPAHTTGSIACNGGTTTLNLSATGGTAPYTGTGSYTVAAGAHSYTITDANGCTANTTITITEPATLNAPAVNATISCGSFATINIAATGGTTPYAGTGSFVLPAGSYTYTVTDANGCTATTPVHITPNASPLVATANAGTIQCNGGTTTITISATGGVAPYTGTGTFTVPSGTHTYTVTDASGCAAITSAEVPQPAGMNINATAGTISCNGGTTAVTVTATGGTAPYSGTGSYTVSAGSYTYTVTDNKGCTNSAAITVTEPATLTATSTAGIIACHGGTTTLNVTPAGGTAPYSGTGTFTVTAGSHTYTVTDGNGCTASTSQTLTEPGALTVSAASPAIHCHGDNTTVTVAASGDFPPFSGTGTFTVTAGTYYYTVTDNSGCSMSTTITVSEPDLVHPTITGGAIACNGGTGVLTVTATGGVPPYSGTGTYTVTAGSYNYVLTDGAGCQATVSAMVTEPSVLNITETHGIIPYFGGTTTVNIGASGGTAPYTGTGSYTVTAGSYPYVVTDANGCIATTTATVPQATNPLVTLAATATAGTIACSGGTTTVTVTADGGVMPYHGTGTYTVTAGSYTYTVTDSIGDTSRITLTITEPTPLTAASTAGNILCNGGTTTVTVTANGGTLPYSGTGTFTANAGGYSYTVTDAHGCTATTAGSLTEPAAVVATATAGTIPYIGATTTVNVAATGGTSPYSGTGTYTVSAGTYTYNVTDANGCTGTTSIVVPQSTNTVTPVAITVTPGTINCYGGTTTVTVTATNGVAPYTGTGTFTVSAGSYTYTVTDNTGATATHTITVTEPVQLTASTTTGTIMCHGGNTTIAVIAAGGTAPYGGVATYTVTAGTYQYTVTDARGCMASTSVTVNEPAAMQLTTSNTGAGCVGRQAGTATVTVQGGATPYTYLWDVNTGHQGTQAVANLRAGTYTVTVTDANGCTAMTTTTIIGDNDGEGLTVTPVVTNATCYNNTNGAIDVNIAGGIAPYSYTWSNGDHTQALRNMSAGDYSVTVTDAANCTVAVTATIAQPDKLTCVLTAGVHDNGFNISEAGGSNGSITTQTTGGSSPYLYAWNNGGTDQDAKNLTAGNYALKVTDNNGCTAEAEVALTEPTGIQMPTGFSPNGDGTNDYFIIHGLEAYPDNTLEVYNRWGNKVWEAKPYNNRWTGLNSKGETLPDGTYYVVLTIKDGKEQKAGYVDLRKK